MSRSNEYSSYGASPSVSKDRWLKHAITKLSKGYMLLVNTERHIANFYRGYGDFESCSYHTARHLIREGYVYEDGVDSTGSIYRLKPEHRVDAKGEKREKPTPVVVDEEEDDDDDDTDLLVDEDVIDGDLDDAADDDLALDID